MYEIAAQYKGLVPIMFNRMFEAETTEPGRAKKKGKEDLLADIPKKMWIDKSGVYIPADNIRMMLIGNQCRPGAAKILGSYIEKNKGTEYTQICSSCVWVLGPKDPLKCYFEPKRKIYDDVDTRSFVTVKGKGVSRKLSSRPLLTLPWSVDFIVQVTDDNLTESFIRKFFDVAGLRCGMGNYGPTFGRCVIEKWEIAK